MRKKWFFGILILAVVGIILTIVFINLFKDRDTEDLAKNVSEVATEGYLAQDSEEYVAINEYLKNVLTYFDDGADKNEIQNYMDSYKAFVLAIDLFEDELIFSKYSKEYNDNVGKIKKNFKLAQKAAENMTEKIGETKNLTGNSPFWNKNTWQENRGFMQEVFENSKQAMISLSTVYTASVSSKLMNNDFTQIIFNGFTALSNRVASDLIDDSTRGSALLKFVNAYYSDENEKYILGYTYNTDLQYAVKDIKEKGAESALYADFLNGVIEGREAV